MPGGVHYHPAGRGGRVSLGLRRDARARVGWLLALLLAAGFAGLAHWQWQRAADKAALLAARDGVLAARRPVAIESALDPEGRALAWFAGRGRFESPLLLLDNQMHAGVAGLRVYAPLHIDGYDTRMLVDLGWHPWPSSRLLPALTLPRAPVDVAGLLAAAPAVGVRVGELPGIGAPSLLLTRIDTAELSAHLHMPLAGRVLRLDPEVPLGYTRDLALLANTLPPERHRGYALQWAALALGVLIWTAWRLRNDHGESPPGS